MKFILSLLFSLQANAITTFIQGGSLHTNSIIGISGVINTNSTQFNNAVDPTHPQDLATDNWVTVNFQPNFTNQSANTVFAGPTSGSAAVPTFRALVAADIPSLSGLYANTALSNLTSPTAINQNLLPGIDNTYNLGVNSPTAFRWNSVYISQSVEVGTAAFNTTYGQNGIFGPSGSPLQLWGDNTARGVEIFGYSGPGQLNFQDTAQNNRVGFQAPATLSASTLWTLPSADSTGTQYLQSNGSGILSWSTPSGFSSPMTTLGDMIYENSTPAAARLPGNTTATKNFLVQTGTGSISAAPTWGTIAVGDVPTLNQNTTGTASNITGTSNSTLTTLSALSLPGSQVTGNISGNAANVTGIVAPANGGTGISTASSTGVPVIASGVWSVDSVLPVSLGGTGAASFTANQVIIAGSTSTSPMTIVPTGTTGQVLVSNGGSAPTWTSTTAVGTGPTKQVFLSGSGTYTLPNPAPLYIEIEMVGGGGAGGVVSTSVAGTNGGNTTFGTSLLVANGGVLGLNNAGAVNNGGTASLGSGPIGIALTGGDGGVGSYTLYNIGGEGASTPFGAGGSGGNGAAGPAGNNAQNNTGAGGGGGGGNSSLNGGGQGGGAGGYVKAIINSPASSYSYAVGVGGTATISSAGGNSGAGGSGIIVVTEYYNPFGGSGTVTSVGLSTPGVLYTVSGSPVTTSGTLTLNLVSQSANTVFAGPTTGSAAAPTFRSLVAADIPTLAGSQVGGFTGGSVIFAGAGGTLTQDNANFFWNDTNDSLGIGTATPVSNTFIDGVNSTGATKRIQLTGYGASSFVGYRGRFARGTSGSPAAAQNGDTLNFISGQGYGATAFPSASTGAVNILANATFTDTSMPTSIGFNVTAVGAVTSSQAVEIAPTGDLLIGTSTDSGTQKLQVNGNSNVGTVTSGTWNGTVTAGQSVITSGTTYTTPAGITTATRFKIILTGGGGGGGGINTASSKGSGGGGGATVIIYAVGLSPSTAYTIAIGSAGAGGISTTTAATAGGNTTINMGSVTYTAGGGTQGADTIDTAGGAGGTATNTFASGFAVAGLNIPGQSGAASGAATADAPWGAGGSSGMYMGVGGAALAGNGAGLTGNAGSGYGGGGGSGNGVAANGGAGTSGVIIVEWNN